MNIYSLLNGTGFLNVNKELARRTNLNAAALFGQLLSSFRSFQDKGMLLEKEGLNWFFLTESVIEEETTLKRDAQASAIKTLVQAGYIITKRFGVPAKRHFHITQKIFIDLVQESQELREALKTLGFSQIDTPISRKRDFPQLDNGNSHNKSAEIPITIKKKKEKEKIKKEKDNKSITHNKRKSRDEIVSEVKELYDGLIDDITYKLVVQRVIDAKPRRFRDYLKKAVETEIKNMQSEKTKKTTRKEMTPDWLKEDTSAIVEGNGQAPEDLEDSQKRLDALLGKNRKKES
ncbi:hypothetical protein [Bacillus cereus]|uniref:hypothetical protein n=1 Tax=Bacillus cereus TaxID=1396 RepID=UPI000BEE0A30|nr:hypothetical protein [Bacillus cereus]PDY76972.1 hypothetical protein CON06_27795 [Bacillus cereus]